MLTLDDPLDATPQLDALLSGVEAVVHVDPFRSSGASTHDFDWLDRCTRLTYNLLWASAQARVGRVVLLSTMDLFKALDSSLAVDEGWRPQPDTSAAQLGCHLSEFVAREFAEAGLLRVAVLRLGQSKRWPCSDELAAEAVVADLAAHDAVGQVHDRWPTELSRRGYSLHHIHDPNPAEGTDYSPPAPRIAPPTPPTEPQVLLLGGRGMLGPHVQSELEDEGYHLRVTDFVAERSDPDAEGSEPDWWGPGGKYDASTPLSPDLAEHDTRQDIESVEPFVEKVEPIEPTARKFVPQLVRDPNSVAGNAGLVGGPGEGDDDVEQRPLNDDGSFALSKTDVDVSDIVQVAAAAEGCSVVVNCAVLRDDREGAWRVNCEGTFNAIRTAVANGHERFINSKA